MAKNNINIKIKADSKDAESGIDKVTKGLNKLAKNDALTGLSRLSIAVMGVQKAFSVVTDAIKKTVDTVKELEETYKVQAKAEIQLETAAKHNPYLSGQAVKNLKEYASYLQSISTTGDEVLLPMMAELAAAGRTETEIQQIMSAALDASASGAISLDTAVTALNASYGGTVGQLGKILPSLKNLTAEELKSGKAIEEVQNAFAGMSEAVASATGTSEQLKNAWGDLKEEMGKPFERAMAPMRKFFTDLITGWTDAWKAKNKYADMQDDITAGLNGTGDNETAIVAVKETISEYENELRILSVTVGKLSSDEKKARKELLDTYALAGQSEEDAVWYAMDEVKKELEKSKKTLETLYEKQKEIEEVKEANRLAEEQADAQAQISERDKLREEYDKKIEKAKEQIRVRRELGEAISEEEEAQLLLNTATAAYIDMMSNPAFKGNSGNYSHEVSARSDIAGWSAIVAKKEDLDKLLADLDKFSEADTVEQLRANLANIDAIMLDLDKEHTEASMELWEKYKEERIEVEDAIAEHQRQKNEETREILINSLNSLADTFSNLNSMVQSNIETTNKNETARLQEQYEDGLIAYEEYCEKKKQLDKESAMETYRINMATWAMQMAQASASVAVGVLKELEKGQSGILTGALIAAAGGVEIGSLIAAKPVRPSFEYGGIVPGSSYSGDHIGINANSAEMVLTRAQQANLFRMIQGGNGGGLNQQIVVQNTISDRAKADVDTSDGQIRILIRDYMKEEIGNGTFDQQINGAKVRSEGVRYL